MRRFIKNYSIDLVVIVGMCRVYRENGSGACPKSLSVHCTYVAEILLDFCCLVRGDKVGYVSIEEGLFVNKTYTDLLETTIIRVH